MRARLNDTDMTDAATQLFETTQAMFADGIPLMNRVLPTDGPAQVWEHYPAGDVVNHTTASRYFYHSHPPEQREDGEHGHFHLFIDKSVMPASIQPLIAVPSESLGGPRADVVHIASLSISLSGLPLSWFTTNRWVTDEWLYPAETVIEAMKGFDMRGHNGDQLVNGWLTAMVELSRDRIAELLRIRDEVLIASDMTGEDRSVEVTAIAPISLEALLADAA